MSLPYRFSDAGGADEQAFLAVASYFQGRVSSGTDRPGRAPTPTNPRTSRPSYRRVRSNFLASASGSVTSTTSPLLRLRLTPRLAPATGPLPLKTGLFEDLPDGVGAHFGQPVRSLTQSPTQTRKRPSSGAILLPIGFPARLRKDALPLGCRVDGLAATSVAWLQGAKTFPVETRYQPRDGIP